MGCCCCKSANAVSDSTSKPTTITNVVNTPIVAPPEKPPIVKPAPPPPKEPPSAGRYNRIGISTTDPSLLIKGFENEPLLSLEEALKPFDGKIPHLNDQIRDAKSKCRHPSEHNLTHDESAALYLYLTDGGADAVSQHLKNAWASNNRAQMEPWFKYLRLLKSGLDKLPDAKAEVWQGTHYDKNTEKILQSKSSTLYTCMGLSSPAMKQVKGDLHGETGSQLMLVGYQSVNGKDVTGYGPINQKETLIWPGMKLNHGQQGEQDKRGAMIYHLTGKTTKKPVEPEPEPEPEPPVEQPKETPRERKQRRKEPAEIHFICPMEDCLNSCRGNHAAGHCYGFSRLQHRCAHHCGPKYKCALCKKHITDLCECKRCHKRFCNDCSFK